MLRKLFTVMAVAAALPAAAEPLNYNIVEFSESAVMTVPRDTMTAHFQVRSEGKERQAVANEFTQKFNAFNRRLKNSAFKTELLSRSVYPRYQYNNGKRTQNGWEEIAQFKVESKDFAALNRLIAEAQNEAHLQHSVFGVSKEKRETIVDEVSKAAILRFKDRAQILSKTLGFSGYKIVKLNLGHIGSRSVDGYAAAEMKMMRAAPMAASADAAVDVASPGVEEISITVDGSVQM